MRVYLPTPGISAKAAADFALGIEKIGTSPSVG